MFCMNCGKELPEEAKFCFSCGEKTKSENSIINMSNKIKKKDLIIENIDDEIIEIKKGTIKKASSVDEIIINENRSIKKNINYTKLRSTYENLSEDEVKKMIIEKNFFDSNINKNGNFVNDYLEETINGDKVIIDRATNLMWHQSGANKMTLYEAKKWLKELNYNNYAEFNDWRLPTLEEVLSIIKEHANDDDLFLDKRFSEEQNWVWTGDFFGSVRAWVVRFSLGDVNSSDTGCNSYVRPVRSL